MDSKSELQVYGLIDSEQKFQKVRKIFLDSIELALTKEETMRKLISECDFDTESASKLYDIELEGGSFGKT